MLTVLELIPWCFVFHRARKVTFLLAHLPFYCLKQSSLLPLGNLSDGAIPPTPILPQIQRISKSLAGAATVQGQRTSQQITALFLREVNTRTTTEQKPPLSLPKPTANLTSSRIEGGRSQLLSKTFFGTWSLSFMKYLYCTSRTNSMFSGQRGFFRLMKPFMNLQKASKRELTCYVQKSIGMLGKS